MRKISRSDVLKLVLVLAFVGAIGASLGAVGRFTPTHAIVEPVYCGACHTDQVRELNATTHLPHFASAVFDNAKKASAGGDYAAELTTAEAVSGGCMMCHNTWNNRERLYVAGYNLTQNGTTKDFKLAYNDMTFDPAGLVTRYNVAVSATLPQYIRLGTAVGTITVTVQDPGTSGLVAGSKLIVASDYNLNGTTGIDLIAGTNTSALSTGTGTVKITYKVTTAGTATVSYKTLWGDLSAVSPATGFFQDDITNKPSCANLEKGSCHVIEEAVGFAAANVMPENVGAVGSGNGIYFQHDMAYTSAEYAAKQVKLCGACHTQKLPPMTPDGEPIRLNAGALPQVIRLSHGNVTFETNVSATSNDWAHRQVQCVRCHGHAGIGTLEEGITGVRSNTNGTNPDQ